MTVIVGGVIGTGKLVVTGWDGGFKVINVNQVTDTVKLIMNVSKVVLDSSCTAGRINVGGVTRLINNSNGSIVTNEVLDPLYLDAPITNIPTNPLLTTDTRLDNLDASISSIPVNPLLITDIRLDYLDSSIANIPTTTLLSADARLDYLDASISSSGLTTIQGVKLDEIYDRLDLNITKPIIYADNGNSISSINWILTKTNNGDGTGTVRRT